MLLFSGQIVAEVNTYTAWCPVKDHVNSEFETFHSHAPTYFHMYVNKTTWPKRRETNQQLCVLENSFTQLLLSLLEVNPYNINFESELLFQVSTYRFISFAQLQRPTFDLDVLNLVASLNVASSSTYAYLQTFKSIP